MLDFWRDYHRSVLFDENAVAGVHLIELLESLSRYPSHSSNYFARMNRSLAYLPRKWREAANLIFSRTIYIPSEFLNDSLIYLWSAALRRIDLPNTPHDIGGSCHFFEIDPSGLLEHFVHHNRIHQRLHPDYYARIFDVKTLALSLGLALHQEESLRNQAFRDLILLARKRYWIILSDKVMSGQSLISDLKRYFLFRKIVNEALGVVPRVIVLSQVITQDALKIISEKCLEGDMNFGDCIYAFKFGEELKVGSDTCTLYSDGEKKDMVVDFCRWFHSEYIVPDTRFDTMRSKSEGNDISLGYHSCGLYFADSNNSPTNSLPPIWYENLSLTDGERKQIPRYQGPYPRVHSRLGAQLIQPSSSSVWDLIEVQFYNTLVAELREFGRAEGN